jgi:predicted DNA binding CopG/RHH family protein
MSALHKEYPMKAEYDLSKFKSRKNPYAKILKRQISIRITLDTINYFKELATQSGITYQNLMDMYLSDCALKQKKLDFQWK